MQQIFPNIYTCLLYVVFHNLEHQNAGLADVNIGVGRFRILNIGGGGGGGGAKVKNIGGAKGGQIPSRHMTS